MYVTQAGAPSLDLAPLAACRHLVNAWFPEGDTDFTPLRQLPWLAEINGKPADLFWFEVDRKAKAAAVQVTPVAPP